MLEALKQSLMITSFVAVMMLVIEYINVLTQGEWQKTLSGSRLKQYLVVTFLGVTPGCLGAFSVVAMYIHGVVSVGAVVAAMIATVGDESFVMLAMIPGQCPLIFGVLFIVGVFLGLCAISFSKDSAGIMDTKKTDLSFTLGQLDRAGWTWHAPPSGKVKT